MKILAGEKLYEYRKTIFRRPVEKVYIYASSPICKIVGEFRISDILEDSPNKLWTVTNAASGVTRSFYFRYFKGKSKAFAIKVKDVIAYPTPINPNVFREDFKAPQSFVYI